MIAAASGPRVRLYLLSGMMLSAARAAAQPMPTIQLTSGATTVSGFGYGGDFAVQLQVAFSKDVCGTCGYAAEICCFGCEKFG